MYLRKNIRKILKEETSDRKDYTEFEKSVKKIINKFFDELKHHKNYHDIIVDVFEKEYGKYCKLILLTKQPFDKEESDYFTEQLNKAKNMIRTFFPDYFKGGISTSISTIKK